MPSQHPRQPEIETRPDDEAGFRISIYDGDFVVQVHPHEYGYQLHLASKHGLGDHAFLRTYERNEDYRRLIEDRYDAVDSEAFFDTLEEHFEEDTEYRIVNVKDGPKDFAGPGVYVYVETGETIPTPVDDREYRNDRWQTDATYRFTAWPSQDYIEIHDAEGNFITDYRPNSHMREIMDEEDDEHERDRAPTCVPGVHTPLKGGATVDSGPVMHTSSGCSHLKQLQETRFKPAGEDPPRLPAGEFGELPLRWCLTCRYRYPTPDELRERYGPG